MADYFFGRHFGQADHADRDPRAGIACRLRLQIVGLAVNDDRAAQHVVQLDAVGLDVHLGDAVRHGFDVAQVAFVMFLRVGPAVRMAVGIVVAAGRHAVGRSLSPNM